MGLSLVPGGAQVVVTTALMVWAGGQCATRGQYGSAGARGGVEQALSSPLTQACAGSNTGYMRLWNRQQIWPWFIVSPPSWTGGSQTCLS